MDYISAKAYARMHQVSIRWVQELCKSGRIEGAKRLNGNGAWMIPSDAVATEKKSKATTERIAKEGVSMVNAEKQMETGQFLLNQADFDMAAVYFEFAGEEFNRRGDVNNAIIAYEKTLFCFETEENTNRIGEIRAIIAGLKSKVEG